MPNWGFEDKTEAWTDGDDEPTDEFGFKVSDFADEAPAEPVNAEKPEKDDDEDEEEDEEKDEDDGKPATEEPEQYKYEYGGGDFGGGGASTKF